MSEQSERLKERTLVFSVAVLRLIDQLPRTPAGDVIARQIAKSATSVAANYRAACTARSKPEFISKLCTVVEEAEESVYWLDVIIRTELIAHERVAPMQREATELRAIFARSLGTARLNLRNTKSTNQSINQSINQSMTR